LVDSSSWDRHFSKSNQRYYYANPSTNEKLYEANGAEPNSGWTRDEKYYSGELKKYRNVFNGEVRYDHEVGAPFHLSKPFPITANSGNGNGIENEGDAEHKKKRKYQLIENENESYRNESKDHMDQPSSSSSRMARSAPSPPLPSSSSQQQHRTMKVANNFLTLQSQKHANWLFGGIAELIHNASDAGATSIAINYFQDHAHNDDDVLEICDNGSGMSPDIVTNILLSFGRNYDSTTRDLDRIGCYGVGFKQGSIRIGSTVIFLTKDILTQTITIGILCNEPYEHDQQMFIYESATLSFPSYRVHLKYSTEAQYEKTTKYISKYSFLTRENISLLIQKHFPIETENCSGTLIFIQKWRQGFDCLEYDQQENDFRLYSNLFSFSSSSSSAAAAGTTTAPAISSSSSSSKRKSLFRQSCHDSIDRSAVIWLDCSLKEYLRYIFYSTSITITLCNETISTIAIEKELINIQPLPYLMPSIDGLSPISGYVGKSLKWEKQKCGGGMFYASNCLIRSFVRNEIGIYNPSDGWGIVLIVNIPVGVTKGQGCGINTTQDKQNFEGNRIYIELLSRIGHAYRKYLQQIEYPIEKIDSYLTTQTGGSGGTITGESQRGVCDDTLHTHWIQCEQCGKWRRVSPEIEKKFHGTIPFYCYHQYSPIMIEIMRQQGNVNNERTRRMACETKQEDYSDEVTQSITTGYEEIVGQEVETREEEPREKRERREEKRVEIVPKRQSLQPPRPPHSSSLSSSHSKENSLLPPAPPVPSRAAVAAVVCPPSTEETSSLSQQSSADDSASSSPLSVPDLYYVLHHPSELQFNWKGEITSIRRKEPEVMTKTYESLYAHLLQHEEDLHSSSSATAASASGYSPYYTCTSDFFYALYLSYSKYEQSSQQQPSAGQRLPILKLKSNYLQTLSHGENLFNLSSIIGMNEACQAYGKLTSKQVAAMSTKCINSSFFILRVHQIPSHAIAAIYNPFPITLGQIPSSSSAITSSPSSSSSSSSFSSSRPAGTTLRQAISRLNTFLSSGFMEWRRHVTTIPISSEIRSENLQNEMKLEPVVFESSSSPSSASSSASSPSSMSSLPVMINEFHLKLFSFFQISPLIPFWLSDFLMKILTNFQMKKYQSCISLIKGCYKHPLWKTFYDQIGAGAGEGKEDGLKGYRKEIRNLAKKNELKANLEIVGELKILFDRLKGL
jgi:hypothetical protein